MENNKLVLSTALLDKKTTDLVKDSNVTLYVLAFTEVYTNITDEVKNKIANLSVAPINVVFTSANAVRAVVIGNSFYAPLWNIYCIGNATKNTVLQNFSDTQIIGTAADALSLATLIQRNEHVRNVYFFCGDQRMDTLPDTLRDTGVEVNEIIVYKTVATPHLVDTKYDAILFFSPSGVNSFFKACHVREDTVLFAIGTTTAEAIRTYVPNKVIVCPNPSKEKMVTDVVAYFK